MRLREATSLTRLPLDGWPGAAHPAYRNMFDQIGEVMVATVLRGSPPKRETARPLQRLFRVVFESHAGRALVPIPKRSKSPRATSTLQWWIV
jgi:hypothetical protein